MYFGDAEKLDNNRTEEFALVPPPLDWNPGLLGLVFAATDYPQTRLYQIPIVYCNTSYSTPFQKPISRNLVRLQTHFSRSEMLHRVRLSRGISRYFRNIQIADEYTKIAL